MHAGLFLFDSPHNAIILSMKATILLNTSLAIILILLILFMENGGAGYIFFVADFTNKRRGAQKLNLIQL